MPKSRSTGPVMCPPIYIHGANRNQQLLLQGFVSGRNTAVSTPRNICSVITDEPPKFMIQPPSVV